MTLIVAGGTVVVLALTSRWWLPALPTLFGVIDTNSELIGAFADLTTIATFVMLLTGGALAYLGFRDLQTGNDGQHAQRSVVVDHRGRGAAVGDLNRGAVVVGDHNRVEVHADVTYAYSEVEASSPDPAELEGARRRLEALPLDEVPEDRTGLPPRSVMRLRSNPNFVGRREDLKRIAANLKTGGATAIGEVNVAASSGLGGVGKTQLADARVRQVVAPFPRGSHRVRDLHRVREGAGAARTGHRRGGRSRGARAVRQAVPLTPHASKCTGDNGVHARRREEARWSRSVAPVRSILRPQTRYKEVASLAETVATQISLKRALPRGGWGDGFSEVHLTIILST